MSIAKAHQQTVAVALSGGIDSLYTLVSLHNQGVPVIGVHGLFAQTIKLGLPEECLSQAKSTETIAALDKICNKLGIDFHVIDCQKDFLDKVILPFAQSYAAGHTPNPCAICNANIKFGKLLEASQQLGSDFLATGHYARLVPAASLTLPHCSCQDQGQGVALLQAADPRKDQSYFLSLVPVEQLAKAYFPLGDKHKKDIIEQLGKLGFTPPQAGESQDVCFIPEQYRDFLPMVAGTLSITLSGPGDIKLANGKKLGTHKGLWQYTEGQRKKLGIGWKEPLYVIEKNMHTNELRLGTKEELPNLYCDVHDVNFLLDPSLWPTQVLIKTRYKEPARTGKVTVDIKSKTMRIFFDSPETPFAAGQIAAVYIPLPGLFEDDGRQMLRLVSGGIIAGQQL